MASGRSSKSSSASSVLGSLSSGSPFTPHPALKLGDSVQSEDLDHRERASLGSSRDSGTPVMPHYKDVVASAPRPRRRTGEDEDEWLSDQTQDGSPHTPQKEALLLEYYWSHYWWRSVA
ncbi:hypothetical protein HOP50_01g04580 [Chloropicon primus]|uniref:Uncharacterized protein n=1 Tax=Chloropicon primus TaxID=1764295 RepID=A0A5B8MF30_9CHLO|nr:hypothetical protein A3770_01p04700 [Chloropicon primus]UPQ97167.1 hypothetical protein HOP50_01g04580 [Chloropicon primus]|mmetsp:Transcript_1891/g.5158  ORF Transcript_1891/g.5158 Transcript_1891/m.5158 type:complete len:119 (+) Transcript_1891:282-638(+)|eukprot:QDZ17952.1 hypothetical protein A3770_01p04700 [Chloropicon primus]